MKGLVRCVLYREGRVERQFEPGEIPEIHADEGSFAWVGMHEPDDDLLDLVRRRFGLHELAVEDALKAHQRPKAEEYGDSLFVVVKTAEWDAQEEDLLLGETHIFTGPTYVVTVRHGPSTSHGEVRRRCESTPQLLRKGPAYVLYSILDFIIDNYFPVMDELEAEVERIEAELFRDDRPEQSLTQRIYRLRGELSEFKRSVTPLLDVFHRLMRVDSTHMPEDVRVYLRDVYDHVVRLNESLDQLRETVHSALDANLALISVRQNETMQMLAAWAAILAVPTLIAGVWGMNVPLFPGDGDWWGFPAVLVGIVGSATLLFRRFRRIGWL